MKRIFKTYCACFLITISFAGYVKAQGPPPSVIVSPGNLDVLKVKLDSFEKLTKPKLILAYTITTTGQLTMHGWSFHGLFVEDFSESPNLRLDTHEVGDIAFNTGTYLGTFVLKEVKKYARLFRNEGDDYVYFIPFKDDDGLVKYWVIGGKEGSYQKDIKLIAVKTIANPSPPKNQH